MDNQPQRHIVQVKTQGVRENTRLAGEPLEAYATFTDQAGQLFYWNGLLMTRDGTKNQKTFKCLTAMGLVGDDVLGWCKTQFQGEVQLSLIDRETKDGRTIKVVDWVNAPGSTEEKNVFDKLIAAGLGSDPDLPF